MALRLRFQYSTDYGALGGGATWTEFADIADTGSPGTVLFTSAVIGTTYWYRSQRYDTVSGLASAWSLTVSHTAVLPSGSSTMNQIDPCDIITAADLKFGIAFEQFPGVPAKARWLIRCEGGYITRQLGRRYGRNRSGNRARNSSAKKGRYAFGGKLRFTFTPERAVPTILGTGFEISTATLSTPTRYEHSFLNNKTCRSVTIWARLSDTKLICYPSAVMSNFTFTPNLESTDVLDIEVDIRATDGFVVQGSTALADSGMNAAVMDLLPEYSQEGFIWSVNGQNSGFRDFTVTSDLDLTEVTQRGYHSGVGFYNKSTGLTIEGQSYFLGLGNIATDMGHSAVPAGNFGPVCSMQLVPVTITSNPCVPNGQTFANIFTLTIPQADVMVSEDAQEAQGEFEQTVQIKPIFDAGGSLGTDFKFSIVNSQTNAQLLLPGVSIDPLKVPVTNSRPYTYDKIGAGASTTVIPLASIANPHIADTDGAYIGHVVKIIKASDGTIQTGVVSAYTAPTGLAAGSVTVSVALGTAPAAGDTIVFLA